MHDSAERLTAEQLADYAVEVGSTLVAYGCPSYRAEEVVRVVSKIEGYRAEAFAIPTGFFVNLYCEDQAPVHRLSRVKEWSLNLERLTIIDEIFNEVSVDKLSIERARERLRELAKRPAPYPTALYWVASAGASAAAAVFFRGGVGEIAFAVLAALLIMLFSTWLSRNVSARLLTDFVGGFVAACVAGLATWFMPQLSREVIVLAGAIALVPGMTLTTALAELTQKSLVSGAARLMDSFMTFLSIVFGIALAFGMEQWVDVVRHDSPVRMGLPLHFQGIALLVASLSFGVLFSVPKKYLWAALLSGAIGYVSTVLATKYLSGHLAAFVAALAVCISSNAFARGTQRPAQLFQLPGMMLLVPGSFGFLSLEDFLKGEVIDGAVKGFQMLLIAGGLVMGVLLANVLLPARKLL